MKPRLFVGSSSEQLDLAYAVQENLRFNADVTVWTQGIFGLGSFPIESLLEALDRSEYGVFIFAPDDILMMRGQEQSAVRDNVIFELGLFIGRLGRKHSFIIAPEGHNMHLPTDLLGIASATYSQSRAKNEPVAAIGSACNAIRTEIKKHENEPVCKTSAGFRITLTPRSSIEIVFDPIQNAKPLKQYGAIVLPSKTTSIDKCITDSKSALGAFFNTHFSSQIEDIKTLINNSLAGGATTTPTLQQYPAGTTIYLNCPLGTDHRIFVCSITSDADGAGKKVDTESLILSLRGMLHKAANEHISHLHMPVFGTGRGGLEFSFALNMILLQLAHSIIHDGFHSIERVFLHVHDPDGKRSGEIEHIAKKFTIARP
jgi:O-acetyl-ADP-ribose deacetylase (regulator of RNase III)